MFERLVAKGVFHMVQRFFGFCTFSMRTERGLFARLVLRVALYVLWWRGGVPGARRKSYKGAAIAFYWNTPNRVELHQLASRKTRWQCFILATAKTFHQRKQETAWVSSCFVLKTLPLLHAGMQDSLRNLEQFDSVCCSCICVCTTKLIHVSFGAILLNVSTLLAIIVLFLYING